MRIDRRSDRASENPKGRRLRAEARPPEDGGAFLRGMLAAAEAERRWLSELYDRMSADPSGLEASLLRRLERSWLVRSSRTGDRRRFSRA